MSYLHIHSCDPLVINTRSPSELRYIILMPFIAQYYKIHWDFTNSSFLRIKVLSTALI